MVILGIDTCDLRGSVGLRRAGDLVSVQTHESGEDFSSWLLPAVDKCLRKAGTALRNLDLLAVATGPGSFTGLRVGLTAVKAWSELLEKKMVGVSRLEVMALMGRNKPGYVAATFDAQRGQIFGGLYRVDQRRQGKLIEQEMVITPDEFVKWVGRETGEETVRWISLDPGLIEAAPSWAARAAKGEELLQCPDALALGVAELGEERACRGEFTDPLQLDANYVRRSDAEIFWKDVRSHDRR